MTFGFLLLFIILLPLCAVAICAVLPSARMILRFIALSIALESVVIFSGAYLTFTGAPIEYFNAWLYMDALSAYNLIILIIVYLLSSLYAVIYFKSAILDGSFSVKSARRFGMLWLGSCAAMILALISNNLGIMWVGIEATTLLTAFLICTHSSPQSLEAMWKYLIMCSVGVAFAFIGTLLAVASAGHLHLESSSILLWTNLNAVSGKLNPELIKTAFIFLMIGYGTKVGLAPMHNWLPDAHSQAPAPVSAVFSGFLLNTALYCIMRYVPIVENALGKSGWCTDILVFFGVVSILIAAPFILIQHDGKRLLAYHSVEHMGIITLGLGLGGIGIVGALFHTLNHSLCKSLGFFSIGRLGQVYKTHDLTRITDSLRSAPVWGMGFFGSIISLIGVAPFAIFMSELQILKAASDARSWLVLILFLLGTGAVFAGALKHGIAVAWGIPLQKPEEEKASKLEIILVAFPLVVLLILGIFIPRSLLNVLESAAAIIRGAR